jgi:hypothetical protein
MNRRATVTLMLTLLSASYGCGSSGSKPDTASGNTSGDTPSTTTDPVTFTMVYTDIVSTACLPCHAPGGTGAAAGGLNMSTQALAYTNLETSASGASCRGLQLVVPGNAAMSLLVEKVESAEPPCGSRMPYGCAGASPCLSTSQIQEISDWINAGAKND